MSISDDASHQAMFPKWFRSGRAPGSAAQPGQLALRVLRVSRPRYRPTPRRYICMSPALQYVRLRLKRRGAMVSADGAHRVRGRTSLRLPGQKGADAQGSNGRPRSAQMSQIVLTS